MTSTTAAAAAPVAPEAEETTEDIAKHSSVGVLLERVNKSVKRNPAMPVGELWQFHLKPLIEELHKFHIDYADDAAAEAMEDAEDGAPSEYVEALVDLVHDGKSLLQTQTVLMLGAFTQLGFIDAESKPTDKMPDDVKSAYLSSQQMLVDWVTRYPTLVEDAPAEEGAKA